MEKGKLLLEYDRRLLPDGVSQCVRPLTALGRTYSKDAAGLEEEDVSEIGSETEESELEEQMATGLSHEEMPAGAKFKKGKKPRNTVKSIDVDYYKLLGLENERWTATDDQIVKAYRKVCLKMHPDKYAASSEAEREKAEDRFKEIQEAFHVLSDETSRRLYDSTDAFDDTLPVDCDPADFFKVFGPAFKRYARWSVDKDVAELGDEETDWETVSGFYDFWYGFKSWREFPHPDEDPSQAENREHRRWIERQNQKLREKAKKDEGKRIREFVDNAYRLDSRVIQHKEAEKQARLERKKEKTKAREEKEALEREQEEREAARLQELEEAKRRQQEEERKIKEAEKKLLKEQRKRLRELCTKTSLLSSEPLDFICLRLDKPKLEKLSNFLEKEISNPEKCKTVLKQTVEKLEEQEKEANEKRAAEQEAARKAYEAARKEESKKKKIEAMREWTEEELKMLDKALNKFPQGTRKRWEQVTNYVRTRTQDEVLIMVKQRQGASSKRFEAQQNWRAPHKDRDIHSEPTMAEASFTDVQLARQQQGGKGVASSETGDWSKEEELSLVKALKAVGKEEADRWGKIAEHIPGKSKAECFKRFKQLRESFRSSTGNGQSTAS